MDTRCSRFEVDRSRIRRYTGIASVNADAFYLVPTVNLHAAAARAAPLVGFFVAARMSKVTPKRSSLPYQARYGDLEPDIQDQLLCRGVDDGSPVIVLDKSLVEPVSVPIWTGCKGKTKGHAFALAVPFFRTSWASQVLEKHGCALASE